MRESYILGVSMTRFGKYLERSLQDLAYDPIWTAIHESDVDPHDIDIAFVGNAYAGLITGQESVRGQVIMREAGITKIPIINVENACASGSTAFYLAHRAVASGQPWNGQMFNYTWLGTITYVQFAWVGGDRWGIQFRSMELDPQIKILMKYLKGG